MQDGRNAWRLGPEGRYEKIEKKGRHVRSAQAILMQRYSASVTKKK
jgi:hypothetical protein